MNRNDISLSEEQSNFCRSMTFLFWWKKPENLVSHPHRTLAGVMDRGGIGEWAEMERIFPPEFIIQSIESAICGEFHAWSWKFWRLRYGLDTNTPLPSRLPGLTPPSGDYWFKALQKKSPKKDNEYDRLKWTYIARDMEAPNVVQT